MTQDRAECRSIGHPYLMGASTTAKKRYAPPVQQGGRGGAQALICRGGGETTMAKCIEAITRRHSNKQFRRGVSLIILFAVTRRQVPSRSVTARHGAFSVYF